MKKAGIIAIIFTCFTFAFAMPSAFANRMNGMGTQNVAPAGDNGTIAEDMKQGMNNMGNNMNRAANRVGNDINRAANRVETDVNRAFDVNDNNRRDMFGTNNVNRGNYRATATTTAAANRGFNWGWLGLIGLFGLAGMRNRDRGRA